MGGVGKLEVLVWLWSGCGLAVVWLWSGCGSSSTRGSSHVRMGFTQGDLWSLCEGWNGSWDARPGCHQRRRDPSLEGSSTCISWS